MRSHNERFLTFLPGQILFSYHPKNILAYFVVKIEKQNLLSLAFNHQRLNCEQRKHKNKDMFFALTFLDFQTKLMLLTITSLIFFKKKLGGQKRLLSVYDLFMYMYYETMTDAFVLPFAATTPTTPPVKGKCLGPMYFEITSSKRAF